MRKLARPLTWVLLCAGLLAAGAASSQEVNLAVAPFAAGSAGNEALARRTSAILMLQIWQTLRVPPTQEGAQVKGRVTWESSSSAPMSFSQAQAYGAAAKDSEPAMVLWGRTWRYGTGIVVEPFLSILVRNPAAPAGAKLWTLKLPSGETLSVGIPRRQVEFEPIILSAQSLPELTGASGLERYASATGTRTRAVVGDDFRVFEAGPEAAKVILRKDREGAVRLPSLSQEHGELVDFSGGLMRILRSDWPGAQQLFERVVKNEHAPSAIKVDSYLYLALAAAKSNADPSPWISKAYELDPYSRAVFQYLCMNQLLHGRKDTLAQLLTAGRPLYAQDDPWFRKVGVYLTGSRQDSTASSRRAR